MTLVRAVTVDLDDTIYPQSEFLHGAWRAVAGAGADAGLDGDRLLRSLEDECAKGSDRGGIIDRALVAIGGPAELAPGLVATFRAHAPERLAPYPGAVEGLTALRAAVPVACVTDGDPGIQRAKLRALGLGDAFDAVVISDEDGRAFRKPHPGPFLKALTLLHVSPAEAVHVGDRPEKDLAGAAAAGMAAIRVRTGEYADAPVPPRCPPPIATVDDAVGAFRLIASWIRDMAL